MAWVGSSFPEGTNLSIDEAIIAAGLGWTVEPRHLWTEDMNENRIGIVDTYAICRSSDNSILGIVGPDYTPLQSFEAFQWFQPFLDSNEATIETAGSLKFGRKVWVIHWRPPL